VSVITFNLLGPQGSGKGTQAKALSKHFDFFHFDMGENLRHISQEKTELGLQVAPYLDEGSLVPPGLIASVTYEQLSKYPKDKDILFDGLLRSLHELPEQTKAFERLDLPLPVIIFLNLDEETAIDRLAHRRICVGCGNRVAIADTTSQQAACTRCGGQLESRHDDTPEAIKHRLAWYHSDTIPVVEHFRKLDMVIDIDAKPAVETVTRELVAKVTEYYRKIDREPKRKQ
jgi:adenylate kinase